MGECQDEEQSGGAANLYIVNDVLFRGICVARVHNGYNVLVFSLDVSNRSPQDTLAPTACIAWLCQHTRALSKTKARKRSSPVRMKEPYKSVLGQSAALKAEFIEDGLALFQRSGPK